MRKLKIALLVLVLFLAACAAKPGPKLEIKAEPVEGKTLCEVWPEFSVEQEVLRVNFTTDREGTYVFSDGTTIEQVRVPAKTTVDAELALQAGTNFVYFSYVEPKPGECWTEYSIQVDLK